MEVKRVDWFRIIADLNGRGLSTHDISSRIGVAQSTLIGWKNDGAEPRYSDGNKLIILWQEICAPIPLATETKTSRIF